MAMMEIYRLFCQRFRRTDDEDFTRLLSFRFGGSRTAMPRGYLRGRNNNIVSASSRVLPVDATC